MLSSNCLRSSVNRLAKRLARPICCFLLVLLTAPHVAHGAEKVIFEPPEDVVLFWARRAGLVIMIFSVLLISFVLVTRRGRLLENLSKWLLFLGLCVLPVPVLFLSSGVGMEESKSVNFCSSCHKPMGPFVRDMKNPDSDTLAALHFKNRYIQSDQCWTCHSDYGVAGTAKAKIRGLTHISYVALDAWQPPIKLFKPYNWRICLQCHAESALFRSPRNGGEAHDGVLAGVLKGETTCGDCHGLAHPAREARSSK